jgi:hypothetical protein
MMVTQHCSISETQKISYYYYLLFTYLLFKVITIIGRIRYKTGVVMGMTKPLWELLKDGPAKATLIKYEKSMIGNIPCYLLTFEDGSQYATTSHWVAHQLELLTAMKVQMPIQLTIGYTKFDMRTFGRTILTLAYPLY